MSKHTSGPWTATKFNPVTGEIDDCYLYVEPGIAVIERKVKGRDQHDIADAHLISAAPDLLEALELYMAAGHGNSTHFGDQAGAYSKAVAAIAKAKGETK
jgi:hypothetical protein